MEAIVDHDLDENLRADLLRVGPAQATHIEAEQAGHAHMNHPELEEPAAEADDLREDDKKGGKTGKAGGGIFFDEAEDFSDFDEVELQGLDWDEFRLHWESGMPLERHVTAEGEQFLLLFMDEDELRGKVMDVAMSRNHHYPTVLMSSGGMFQIQHEGGNLNRIRATPYLDRDGIRAVMGAFRAEGKSIDPKHVSFGRSPAVVEYRKRIWTEEFNKMRASKPHADMLRPSPRTRRSPGLG